MAPDNRAQHLLEIRTRLKELMGSLLDVDWPVEVMAALAPAAAHCIAMCVCIDRAAEEMAKHGG